MRCVTRHDVCQTAETEALKQSILTKKVIKIACCDSSIFTVLKYVQNFITAFKRRIGASSFAVQIVDIEGDMALSDFLTDNGSETIQRYIQASKFLLQHPNIPNSS